MQADDSDKTAPPRRVRSFVRREGRLTPGQERALESLMGPFGVPQGDTPLDLDGLFGRPAPRHLEIGFGNGEQLLALAEGHPETDFLGIEVHRPGLGRLLLGVEQKALTNVRVSGQDAVELLANRLPDHCLDAVYVLFPDPWPKKRHHKRRLVSAAFAALVARKLRPGGDLFLATDWEDYAHWMLDVLDSAAGLENQAGHGRFAARPPFRIETKFERRGRRLGHGVWDLHYKAI